jgi:hypothetical protein
LVHDLITILHELLSIVRQVLVIALSNFHDFVCVEPQGLLRTFLLFTLSVLF